MLTSVSIPQTRSDRENASTEQERLKLNTYRSRAIAVLASSVLALTACHLPSGTSNRVEASASATLDAFAVRAEFASRQLPQIIAAAEAVAERKAAHADAVIHLPYEGQSSFATEMIFRSGGLAELHPSNERREGLTDHDILVYSVRSWANLGPSGAKFLAERRRRGWLVILFASKAGMPDDLDVDFLIDNGATTGREHEAAVNLLANCLHGWIWTCEYAAALTRRGSHPGFLRSITLPGSQVHNRIYQNEDTRHQLYPCAASVPPGLLARIYLERSGRMIDDLSRRSRRDQIDHAARLIAQRLGARRPVFVSTNSHLLLEDLDKHRRSPWIPLNTVWHMKPVLAERVQPGDLFVWFAFNGVSVRGYEAGAERLYHDYDAFLRDAEVDLITCFATDPLHPYNNGHGALAHIEQDWDFGDAEVPVPFPPGRIAPVSGLYQGLLYRMLDEAVADRLR